MTHKVGVFGDIHGNLPALEAVLDELSAEGIYEYYCTGDIVGYCGWSAECIREIRTNGTYVVPGNHDCRVREDHHFVPSFPAAQAEHHVVTDQLDEQHIDWLSSLPLRDQSRQVTLAHSWPARGRDEQSLTGFYGNDRGCRPADFPKGGSMLQTKFGFLGHTHEQHAVDLSKFEGQRGLLVNPGSVGIPRDGRAEYAVVDLDTQEYELCNTEFDAKRTSERVAELAENYDLEILTE